MKSFTFVGPNFRGFMKICTFVGTLFRGLAGWFKFRKDVKLKKTYTKNHLVLHKEFRQPKCIKKAGIVFA